ncbi:MAG: hypothetical protein IPJ65_28820 [Archangiaceae bacterium]|nr:hypothetical protein [Archangiaceae bacterium]
MSTRPRRKVKSRVLLVATAGAAVVTLNACWPFTAGNLVAPPQCGADAGPPGCYDPDPVEDQDGGTDGGHDSDGGDNGDH